MMLKNTFWKAMAGAYQTTKGELRVFALDPNGALLLERLTAAGQFPKDKN